MNESQCIKEFRESGNSVLGGYIYPIPYSNIGQYVSVLSTCDIWEKDNPFGITAFGDILAVDNEGYIIMYKLVDAEKTVICANAELFFKLINDKEYQADYFALDEYEYAKKNIGILEKDECYTYEPIPALGGNKSRNTISKGKKVEYLSILTSFL